MVLELELLSLASLWLDSVLVWCGGSSSISLSLCEPSSLELVPVPVLENISLWKGVSVYEVTLFSVIVEFIVFISLLEGVWMSE